ncbi:MAG: glycosyltransferase family 2 protein [Lachnospiraceae bacterium]|nr:glycosyltransferase family 2 protein [Lachnospiraceae bacterium]
MRRIEISVIMSVYDPEENYLREAIESILMQSFPDFEFIIVDDGCCEKIQGLLQEYKKRDDRILIIKNHDNIGLTKSLNKALEQAQGKYIARMDADDVSDKNRLKLQYQYMESHLEIGAVGSFTSDGKKVSRWSWLASSEWRKVNMLFSNYGICHPSAFLRKEILDKYNIKYNEQYKKAQDYDLWVQLLKVTNIKVYPKVLLFYREHAEQISIKNKGEQDFYRDNIRKSSLLELCGNVRETELEQFLHMNQIILDDKDMAIFFNKIQEENLLKKIYNYKILKCELIRLWKNQHRQGRLLHWNAEKHNALLWVLRYWIYLGKNFFRKM